MKNYILAIAVLLSGVAASCNKDAEGAVYAEREMAFSFVNAKQVMEVEAGNAGVVKIPVYRSGRTGEAKVEVMLDAKAVAENVLKLQTLEVTFKDGEPAAYVEMSFVPSGQWKEKKYTAVLTFKEGTRLSPSAKASTEVTIQRK